MSFPCVVLGGGGHAQVVIDCLLSSEDATPVAVLDPHCSAADVLGVPVEGGDEQLSELVASGVDGFVVGVGHVGDPGLRRRLFELGRAHGLFPVTLIHPSASVSPFAVLDDGAQVMAGAVVHPGAVIGENALINTRAVVEHDCEVGDHAHVASGAVLAGNVRVGEGGLVGAGATVIQGVRIGEGAVVGAGAVVRQNVAPGTTVVGVPARPTGEE